MLTKRHRRAKDKLSVTDVISLDETADAATIAEWCALVGPGAGGFEWKLREAERIWRPLAPRDGERPEEHSLSWYASEILFRIRAAREAFTELTGALVGSHRLEELALHALEIGHLYEEGRWRDAVRPLNQFARHLKAKTKRAGRRSGRGEHGELRRQHARALDQKIINHHGRLRRTHPYDRREHSSTWLAEQIGARLDEPWEGIRKRMRRLGLT